MYDESLTLREAVARSPVGWQLLVCEAVSMLRASGLFFTILNVKDAYGALRIQVAFFRDRTNPEYTERVNAAFLRLRELEKISLTRCQECGRDAQLRQPKKQILARLCEGCATKLV